MNRPGGNAVPVAAGQGIDNRAGRRRRLWIAVPLGVVAALAAAWLVGLLVFVQSIVAAPVPAAGATDAVVVLTGGSNRLDAGLVLLRDGRARSLFVSGVDQKVRAEEMRTLLIGTGVHLTDEQLRCCVALGYLARDTIGNAAETAAWMRQSGFRSLRLVTSNYHMARSLLEFRHVMPDTVIVPHPVLPEDVRLDSWWSYPGTLRLFAIEYVKLIGAALRIWLVLPLGGGD